MGKSETFKIMFTAMRDVPGPVTLKMDLEHPALEAFVHFFYTGFIKDEVMDTVADKLLRASDKYRIDLLHKACQEKLINSIYPDRIFQYYLLGNKCHAEHLVHAVITYVANNFSDISEIAGYDDFLKDDPALVARLSNGVVRRLKLKLRDHHIS